MCVSARMQRGVTNRQKNLVHDTCNKDQESWGVAEKPLKD